MSKLIATILAGMMLLAAAVPTESHHKPYPQQVKKARQWLKSEMTHSQFRCLHTLWHRESHWRVKAENPYSGAYGIPQALPGKKMRKYGKRWRTRAMIQVKWGKNYVRVRYGGPCSALRHQNIYGWY